MIMRNNTQLDFDVFHAFYHQAMLPVCLLYVLLRLLCFAWDLVAVESCGITAGVVRER